MADKNTADIGFEKQIWNAACVLRGNMDASEYKNVVLGLIFLKYISDRFDDKYRELKDEGDGFEEDIDEYISEGIFFVPEGARWSEIAAKAHTPEIGTVIDEAMRAIEKENKRLKDILPKNFARPELDKRRLGDVVDLFTNIQMIEHGSEKDILGRTYEYCLSMFAEQEGKRGGEFFTPSCVVRTLVEVLKPFKGRVYDPCCGSGGMFVQSAKFVENHSGNISNGDTIMARITPCLENGKTAQVSILNDGEVGFGSTEYIVFRAKEGIADKWANGIVKDYTIKGWVMDEERLKNGGSVLTVEYFDRLLEQIREIRLSERRFYQKITDIYATALDYDRTAKTTKQFFAKVQNKMHYAVHGRTAELIYERADADKPHMGLTTWAAAPEGKIVKSDVSVAKNYLSEKEMRSLERIVSAYLDLAEDRAERHIPMTMEDWAKRLDLFLMADDREVLQDAGKITAEIAKAKAETEFEKYRVIQDRLFMSDFDKYMLELEENAKK